jgi:tight adherence protein B
VTSLLPVALAAAAAVTATVPVSAGRARLAALARGPDAAGAWRRRLQALPAPGVAGVAALLVAGPAGALTSAAVTVVAQRLVAAQRVERAASVERSRAQEALSVLAGDLRVGRAPASALAVAAGLATDGTARALAAAATAADLGGDVAAALQTGESAVPEVLRGLAACWRVCTVSGSGLAGGVERLADGLRAAEAQRQAVAAELAGPRATAGLLAMLPLGGIGLAAALGAHPVHVLLRTRAGGVCLLVGVALDVAGVLWTQRLVARAVGT